MTTKIKIEERERHETATVYARGVKKVNKTFLEDKAREANYPTPGALLDHILDQARRDNPVRTARTTTTATKKTGKKKVVRKKVAKKVTRKPAKKKARKTTRRAARPKK